MSEFDTAKHESFKKAIASTAGVNTSSVEIVSFAQKTRRSESRNLQVASIDVETKIVSADGQAQDLVEGLDIDTVNKNLAGSLSRASSVQKLLVDTMSDLVRSVGLILSPLKLRSDENQYEPVRYTHSTASLFDLFCNCDGRKAEGKVAEEPM